MASPAPPARPRPGRRAVRPGGSPGCRCWWPASAAPAGPPPATWPRPGPTSSPATTPRPGHRRPGRLRGEDPPRPGGPALLDGRALLVVAPGLPEAHPLIQAAPAAKRIPVWSEIELAARVATMPLVGVTGTNGKTTTTELAAAMLTASRVQAVAAGNVELPLIDAVLDRHLPDAVVVELSNFQLRFTWTLHLQARAWLNAADHLDWHPGPAAATACMGVKSWASQGPDDWSVYGADDPVVAASVADAGGTPVPFTTGRGAGASGWRPGWPCPGSQARGQPVAGGRPAPPPAATTWPTPSPPPGWPRPWAPTRPAWPGRWRLPGGAHRLAEVGEVREVRFVNDSKATNPHAATRALAAFPGSSGSPGAAARAWTSTAWSPGRPPAGQGGAGRGGGPGADGRPRADRLRGPGGAGGLGRRGRHRRVPAWPRRATPSCSR